MKIIKSSIILTATVLGFYLITSSAWAGSKQQHRWEGAAIGVGAVIVGSALINQYAYGYHYGPPVAFSFNYREVGGGHNGYSKRYRGHWQSYYGDRYREHRRHSTRQYGRWQSHYYGHPNAWRSYDRGPHYRGQHGPWNSHGKWDQRSGRSYDRRDHGGQRSHKRGHGEWRR